MFLDPKKGYPSVRVRLVDYKTKAMVDISLPSEYFEDSEIDKVKAALFKAIEQTDLITAQIGNSKSANEDVVSDKELEASVFSEEEKDGED